MQITMNPKPLTGVSQLMVVGDVPTVASIVEKHPVGALAAFFLLGYVAGNAIGITRVVAVGAAVAAGYAATRVIAAQPIDDLVDQ